MVFEKMEPVGHHPSKYVSWDVIRHSIGRNEVLRATGVELLS